MSDQRWGGISWTNETWNPIRGCRRVNTDCQNCYAERLAATRLSDTPAYRGLATMTTAGPRWTGKVVLDEETLRKPLSWTRPRLVFTNAMSDLFYDELSDAQIDRIVAVMAMATKHTFQVLTKRPARMATYLETLSKSAYRLEVVAREFGYSFHWDGHPLLRWPIRNIWWGASMGHQQAVDAFSPHVRACRHHAEVLWISAEPLIGSVTIDRDLWIAVDWLVAGGESGPDARPTHPDWFRAVRDECQLSGTAFHFKQWGEWAPDPGRFLHFQHWVSKARSWVRHGSVVLDTTGKRLECGADFETATYPATIMHRVGKKSAGRHLDGVQWNEFPKVAA